MVLENYNHNLDIIAILFKIIVRNLYAKSKY